MRQTCRVVGISPNLFSVMGPMKGREIKAGCEGGVQNGVKGKGGGMFGVFGVRIKSGLRRGLRSGIGEGSRDESGAGLGTG